MRLLLGLVVDKVFDDGGPMKGRCISVRSDGVAITLANCLP